MKDWLETLLNRYLALDPETAQRLSLLQNKVATIELVTPAVTFQLVFLAEKITVRWEEFLPAAIVIRGTPLNLLHMGLAPKTKRHFFAEDVLLEGDLTLAQPILALFDELEIDWEEYLSRWLGDVPAYQAGRFVKKIRNVATTVGKNLLRNLNEYSHEEINLFPPLAALEGFFQEVDTLRMDVDRLEARILHLQTKLQAN